MQSTVAGSGRFYRNPLHTRCTSPEWALRSNALETALADSLPSRGTGLNGRQDRRSGLQHQQSTGGRFRLQSWIAEGRRNKPTRRTFRVPRSSNARLACALA